MSGVVNTNHAGSNNGRSNKYGVLSFIDVWLVG